MSAEDELFRFVAVFVVVEDDFDDFPAGFECAFDFDFDFDDEEFVLHSESDELRWWESFDLETGLEAEDTFVDRVLLLVIEDSV